MLKALLLSLAAEASAKAALTLTTLALAGMATAQNLVVNGSFEDTVNCAVPTQCTLLKAEHWYNPNLATPDLFDADLDRLCGYAMDPSQPTTFMEPYDGMRLAGAYFWYPNGNTREYLMGQLSEGLQPGAEYEVSVGYARRRPHQYAVDHIAVWIGHDSLFENTTGRLDVLPQVKLRDPFSTYLVSGDAWTQLTDTFTAVGGERWVVIGNFDAQDSVNGVLADATGLYSNCYYYIDSVVVRAISATNIPEIAKPSVWCSGHGVQIHWNNHHGPVEVHLLDAAGRSVQRVAVEMNNGHANMPLPALRSGVYLMQLRVANEEVVVKFVKEEGGF